MIRLLIVLLFLSSSSLSFAQQIQVGKTIETSHEKYAVQFYRGFVEDKEGNVYSGVFYNNNYKPDADKGDSYIEQFDKDLNIIKTKKIEPSNASVSRMLSFFTQKNQLYSINLEQEKNKNNLYLYEINKNTLEANKKELVISANKIYKFQRYNHCKVVLSEDKQQIAVFALSREKGGDLGLITVLYNQNMDKIWETTTILPSKATDNGSYRFKNIYIDDKNVHVIIENHAEKKYILCNLLKDEKKVEYEKIERNKGKDEYIASISISKINEQMKWLMFISKKWNENIETLQIVDIKTKEATSIEIGHKIANKDKDQYLEKNKLYHLEFKNIFTYDDGSIIITSEYTAEYERSVAYNIKTGYIYTLCIDKNTKMLWEDIINKSQDVSKYSEMFLSFTSMKDNEGSIHIFFVQGINDVTLHSPKEEFLKTTGITHKIISKEGKITEGKYIPREEDISKLSPIFMAKNSSNIKKDEYIFLESSPKNKQRIIRIKLLDK